MDLTILYITANEMPARWTEFAVGHLLKAAAGAPIVSVSKVPIQFGENLLDDRKGKSYWNIYRQMRRAAEVATTPYVAMAEDDTLYTQQHFHEFRPPMDTVAYDRSRWSLFSWDPVYCLRQRVSNCSLIAPREFLIAALREREEKWPTGAGDELAGEVGRRVVERRLGVRRRRAVEFYSRGPIVQLNHPTGTDAGDYGTLAGKRMVKRHGQIQAFDIPYWGKAADIAKVYNDA